jgi:hypothetical protein
MSELNPEQQRLAEQLQRQARAVEIGNTPVATVVRRGRQRRDRRKVGIGLAAVLTVSAAAIGTIQFLSKPVSHRIVAAPTDTTPTEETTPAETVTASSLAAQGLQLTPVNRVESNLQWNAVTPNSSEALSGINMGYGAGAESNRQPPYLAWSTAPGRAKPNDDQAYVPRLWRSDDGIHWQLASSRGGAFVQPDVQAYGVGSFNGRLLAFGTAAATAPIPKGGGGDVVVDVSDDQGASWQHRILPFDLRGISKMDGVQAAGFQGSFAVGLHAMVAVGVTAITFTPSLYERYNGGGFAMTRQGLTPMTYPNCAGAVPTTISLLSVDAAAPGSTTPAATISPDATDALAVDYPTPAMAICSRDSGPPLPQVGQLVSWSEAGVDQRAIDALFTPRVFVSTDGQTFTEGSFPPSLDGYQPGSLPQLFATDNGFVGIAQFNDAAGHVIAKLYTSSDGLTWTETDTSLGQFNALQAMPDGTLVAFGQDFDGTGYSASGPWVASSPDGVEWTKRSLSGLLDPSDGKTAVLNAWQMSAGPNGVTALGNIDVDAAAEAGGLSIDKDGVRLTMTSSRNYTFVATDIASGAELGRYDGRAPDPNSTLIQGDGGWQLRNADGSLQLSFSDQEVADLQSQQLATQFKSVILHSTDGVNWSRDDVAPLAGFDTTGGGHIQVTDSNVLVSVSQTTFFNTDGRPADPKVLPKTVVLVGVPKS